ncbi:lysine--tRNA ligase, partial [Candidatus Woesearchaeota archaeon]|nr:lysine--tRNA ligase [Candidatus Woesearchaeota archaeon]
MGREEQIINERKRKLKELIAKGVNPYPHKFDRKNFSLEIKEKYKKLKNDERSKGKVSVAGRIMTLRSMGKAGFAHIQDETGKIQIYVRKDEISEESFNVFSKSDLGDIIGIKGTVFRTKKGEVSIRVKEFVLLSKCVRPLPEKWHGLKDKEARYRKRYLDLITNPE